MNRFTTLFILLFCLVGCNQRQGNVVSSVSDAYKGALKMASDEQLPYGTRLQNSFRALELANGSDQNILESERTIATIYLEQNDLEAAKKHFQKVVSIAQHLSNKEDLAISLNNIGIIYYLTSNYDSALKYYNEANLFFRTTGNRKYLAQNFINLGMIYKLQGNYQEAFKVSIEGVQVLQQLNEKNGLGSAYTTVADILQQLYRPEDALYYHLLAFKVRKDVNDSDGMGMSLNNIGNSYRYFKKYHTALSSYQQSLQIKEKIGLGNKTGNLLSNIGQCYFELHDYANAEHYFKKAIELCAASVEKNALITANIRLARLFFTIGKYRQAEKYAFDTQNMFPSEGFSKEKVENCYLLSEILAKLGKTEYALEYADSTVRLKDSLFKKDMENSISEMQIKYKTEQKEKELLLTRQNAAAAAERNKIKLRFWGAIGLLVIAASATSFYFYRKRQQYLFRQRILEIRQEAVTAQLDTHFIGDTIDTINSFVEDNNKEVASEYLLKFSRLIRTVLANSFRKMIPLHDDLIALYDYFSLAKLRFSPEHVTISVIIDEDIDLETTLVPPMILQVLVGNALKHAFITSKGGVISVRIYPEDKALNCVVTDNGIGRIAVTKTKNSNSSRVSYGNELAQELLKIWEETEGKTSYEINDLADENGNPTGTQCKFSFPLILNK